MALHGVFEPGSNFEARYIEDYETLSKFIKSFRELHPESVVGFVGGVWDLIHLGHLDYLELARKSVDFLIVGADTDEWVKERKGSSAGDRPVVLFQERVKILSHIRHIHVVTKVTKDFISLLQAVQPDVLIISKTTKELTQDYVEEYSKYVKKILPLDAQAPPEEVSTTARIRKLEIFGYSVARKEMLSAVDRVFDRLEGKEELLVDVPEYAISMEAIEEKKEGQEANLNEQ